MMKIVIAQPPIRDFYQSPHRHSAMGSLTVQKILEEAGHSITLFNFPSHSGEIHTPPLPRELNYLKAFLITDEKGPVTWFRQRKHFGPSFNDCCQQILSASPERVMISCLAWCYAEEAVLLAKELKKHSPDLPLDIGGAGVSVNPDWFRKTGLFEKVRCGEAEKNMTDLPGVKEESHMITPVLSPAYRAQGKLQYSTMLTRGCPYRCQFCANHLTHGRNFRKIAIEDLLILLEQTHQEEFHLNLEDDNLLADADYFCQFLDSFHFRYPGATLSAENGLDYRHLTHAIINKMIDSGFIRFNLSMASTDSQILSDQNRTGQQELLSDVLFYLKQNQIPAVTYFICGLEGDSLESVSRNLLFLASHPTEIGISPFYAVPGLPGFDKPGDNSLPESPALYCGSSVWPWNKNLTTAQLITAFRLSRFINLLKSENRFLWQNLIQKTLETCRLHTICGSKENKALIEVPLMDNKMSEIVIKNLPENLI
ncbi:radical SAM protein [Oceanispirochaeta crateris]|uniref:Radical SAM protein n=1 Tax=Oceanispirochaeta crateris TaxID=2518645 RepID=A0A5C1QQR5_9SPIO|nr:radical SAM protein [Oceanispirochaeta crateris]QEN09708.1 radical SAM protein [Oceanispirochaeta crateris]